MSLFIYERANALSRFSCMLVRKYVLISFTALNDRSPVAVVIGNVATIYSNVSVIGYVPSCLAVLRGSRTFPGRRSDGCRAQQAFQCFSSASKHSVPSRRKHSYASSAAVLKLFILASMTQAGSKLLRPSAVAVCAVNLSRSCSKQTSKYG